MKKIYKTTQVFNAVRHNSFGSVQDVVTSILLQVIPPPLPAKKYVHFSPYELPGPLLVLTTSLNVIQTLPSSRMLPGRDRSSEPKGAMEHVVL